MIVVVMGVAGAGKSTVGRLLASELGWPFVEGDHLHPPANIAKMAAGTPLTDADRGPWLAAIAASIGRFAAEVGAAVVACSALKQAYRDALEVRGTDLRFVLLRASEDLVRRRLAARRAHFFPPGLLASQFADLEEPAGAVVVDAALPPAAIVRSIRAALSIEEPS